MNNPLVSIIIPTYNRADLISETLDSVLAQTYSNWECIIVDDGSSDNTDDVVGVYLLRDSRFQYHHRPSDRPKGANACRNYGFELSKGEYINWFDDDDVMLEDFLKVKTALFNSRLDLVICSGYYVDDLLEKRKTIELNYRTNLFKEYILWQLKILTPSILFRKSFLTEKELFSYRISRGQETELYSRLFFKLTKDSFKIVDSPLFLYRQHAVSKTAKNSKYVKGFKESQSYITVENFKKSLEINDLDLINYNYKALLDFFFRGLENDHCSNSRYVLNHLITALKSKNKKLTIELFFLGQLFLAINKGSYRIEKRLKNYQVI